MCQEQLSSEHTLMPKTAQLGAHTSYRTLSWPACKDSQHNLMLKKRCSRPCLPCSPESRIHVRHTEKQEGSQTAILLWKDKKCEGAIAPHIRAQIRKQKASKTASFRSPVHERYHKTHESITPHTLIANCAANSTENIN